jgi:hypothetical protein
MMRRLFNLAAAVSLVTTLAVVALWVRCHSETNGFLVGAVHLDGSTRTDWFVCGDGRFTWSISELSPRREGDPAFVGARARARRAVGWYSRADKSQEPVLNIERTQYGVRAFGFVYEQGQRKMPIGTDEFARYSVPCWFIALFAVPMPACWIVRRTQVRRRGFTGLCRHCGYDLRATPDRCPECGTASTSSGQASAAPKPAEAAA